MNLKKHFVIINIITIGLLIGLLAISMIEYTSYLKFEESQLNRDKTIKMAFELRQSSEDLTKYCRTYVISGDSLWENKYWDLLDIRNGIKPRIDGKTIALHDSLVKLGISKDELSKLEEAEKNSNNLVQTEKKAFNALKGIYMDTLGIYSIKGKPDTAFAQKILFDEKYYADKEIIMQPIEDFFYLIEKRTAQEVYKKNLMSKTYLSIIILLIVCIAFISIISFFSLRIKISKKINELFEANAKIKVNEEKLIIQNQELDALVNTRTEELYVQNVELNQTLESLNIADSEKKEMLDKLLVQNKEYAALNEEYFTLNEELSDVNKELSESKETAEENERKLKTLIGNLQGMVYRCKNDQSWTMEYVSKGVHALTGYEQIDFIENKTLSYGSIIHHDFSEKVWSDVQKALKEKEPFTLTYKIVCASGKEKWVWEQGQGIYKDNELIAIEGFVTDITKEKKIEAQLLKTKQEMENSLARFKHIFENNPVSLWEEDFSEVKNLLQELKNEGIDIATYLNGNPEFVQYCASKITVRNVNAITLNLFKAKSKTDLIQNVGKTFNENSIKTFVKLLVAISNNEYEFEEETEYVTTDGNIIFAIIKIISSLDNSSSIVSIIDITKHKEFENILHKQNLEYERLTKRYQEQNHQLMIAKDKAEESDKLKTEFIHNMSHEIRTPMNGILGFSEILNNPNIPHERRKLFIEIIQNSSRQLMRIIDDILEISTLETKQVRVFEKEVCLNDKLLEIFSIFDLRAKENKIPLYLKKGLSDERSIVLTDFLKLSKILNNLLENALKFTQQGFVEFGYVKSGKYLNFYVKDTGIGIKKEQQESIFKRFSQEEKDLSKSIGGLGLGLSIAKENTELLGGKIWVNSEKGKGATFNFSIPYKPINSNFENDYDQSESNYKCSVLIVEDEEVNSIYLETLFDQEFSLNCQVLKAFNGREAVDMCQENNTIDLVLMDLKMPVMNGFEATQKIKKLRPELPIIAQSAYSTDEDKSKAFLVGCDDYIVKPIDKQLLKDKVFVYFDKEKTL